MAAFGLREEDYGPRPEAIEVWPENWEAALTFVALATQWRSGMNGPTGLDYGAIEPVLRLRGVASDQWSSIFDALRIMESEALDVMREGAGQS